MKEINPSVSVVIPVYNEEKAISGVIREVRDAMERTKKPYEIIIVDDASNDKTAEAAKAEGAHVIRRPIRGGAGASRKTGIKEAKGGIVVMLDGDGSYSPNDIPKLLECFPEYDQANGARTSEQGTLKFFRVPAKWFIRKLACYLTGVNIPDLNTGLKAFKRDIMLRYLWVISDGFSCVTTMTLAFLCNGYNVKYIPTEYRKRIGESKFHPIKDALSYLQTVVRMVMYFRPLRVFMPVSLFLFILGVGHSIYSLVATRTLQESDIIVVMAAIIIAAIGLLADVIVAQRKA